MRRTTKHGLSAFLLLLTTIAQSCSSMRVHIGSHQLPHRSATGLQKLQQLPVTLPAGQDSAAMRTQRRLEPVLHPTIKLPVWPVYNGVIAQVLDWLNLSDLSNRLINALGGRVQPISLASLDLSPFLLLVHHSHSFTPYDPFRAMTQWFLPEGFPAHPHSGFDTMTYCIRGGLRHRDSEGVSMRYGDGDVQWMRAGRGVIHEEMWDVHPGRYDRIEIFQLWVNLPGKEKGVAPFAAMLRKADIPVVATGDGCCRVKVICGEVTVDDTEGLSISLPDDDDDDDDDDHDDDDDNDGSSSQTMREEEAVCGPGDAIAGSNMAILHLEMEPHSRVDIRIGAAAAGGGTATSASRGGGRGGRGGVITAAAYVRRGSLSSSQSPTDDDGDDDDGDGTGLTSPSREAFDQGSFVIFRPSKEEDREEEELSRGSDSDISRCCGSVMTVTAGADGLDALLLLGEPLGEEVVWQGPFVQRSERELQRSARAFEGIIVTGSSRGGGGGLWGHRLSDPEWEKHVEALRLQETLTRLD